MVGLISKSDELVDRLLVLYGKKSVLRRSLRRVDQSTSQAEEIEAELAVIDEGIFKLFDDVALAFSEGSPTEQAVDLVWRLALERGKSQLLAQEVEKRKQEIGELLEFQRELNGRKRRITKRLFKTQEELESAVGRLEKIREARAKGGASAQRENRQLKREAFVWLDLNGRKYKSMSDAATSLERFVPVVWRTAYEWVREWKKGAK